MNYRLRYTFIAFFVLASLLFLSRSPSLNRSTPLISSGVLPTLETETADGAEPVQNSEGGQRSSEVTPNASGTSSESVIHITSSRGKIEKGRGVVLGISLYDAGTQESVRLSSVNGTSGEATSILHGTILDSIPWDKRSAFEQGVLGIKFQVHSDGLVSSFDTIVYSPLPAKILVQIEESSSLRIYCEESLPFQYGSMYVGSVALSPRSGRSDSQQFPQEYAVDTEEPVQIDGLVAGEYVVTLGDGDLSFFHSQVVFVVRGEVTDIAFPASGVPVEIAGRCLHDLPEGTDFVVSIRGTGANVEFQTEVNVASSGDFNAEVPSDGEYFAFLVSKEQLGLSRVMIPLEQRLLVPPDVSKFDLLLKNGGGSIIVEETVARGADYRGRRIFLTLDSESSESPNAWNSVISDVVALGLFDEQGRCRFDNVPSGDYLLDLAPSGRQLRTPIGQVKIEGATEKFVRYSPPGERKFTVALQVDGGDFDITGFAASPLLLKSGNEIAGGKLLSVWSRVTNGSNTSSSWAPALFKIVDRSNMIEFIGPDIGDVELFVRVLDAGTIWSAHLGQIRFPDPRSGEIVAELVRSGGLRVRTESVSGLGYPFHIFLRDRTGRSLPFFGGSNFQKFEHYVPGLPPGKYGVYVVTPGQAAVRRDLTLDSNDRFVIF